MAITRCESCDAGKLIPYWLSMCCSTALSSPMGVLLCRVKVTDVDVLNNVGGTLDSNSPIGMDFFNQKGAFFHLKFALYIIVGQIGIVANLVLKGNAVLVLLSIVSKLAATAAIIDKAPIFQTGGCDDHVASKGNLGRVAKSAV
eukprot:12418529-Ditylum_brightwellii.AAC.1